MAEPKEKKVKKVQARHILVKSKEIGEEVKKKVDDGEDFAGRGCGQAPGGLCRHPCLTPRPHEGRRN